MKLGKQWKIAAISIIVGNIFSFFILLGPVERLNIDILNVLMPSEKAIEDIVVVAIDETSFSAFETQWPWPREYHGMLVERLVQEGAKDIIFDVVFAEPSEPESDGYFADAITMAENVILASDLTAVDDGFITGIIETRPYIDFEEAGARVGLAGVDQDNDRVIRYFPSFEDTLSSVAAQYSEVPDERSKIINYIGPDHSFKYISYNQFFIDDGIEVGAIEDKYVLIGLDVKATPDVQQSQVDAFPTPHTRFNARLSPGVEVHANMLQNLISDSWIVNPSNNEKIFYLIFMAIIGFLATQTFNPYYSFGALAIAALGAFGASVLSWQQGYFLTAFAAFPTYIISFVSSGAHAYLTEGKQKRQIKGAFAQYLAPEMVDALIADPDKLTLGGEKRTMTIMFCDVRGFTAISEALKEQPEVLAEVINTLLTELTNDILECGGTIDKYMGDCIMAFWNAPVENPEHAQLAVEAAQKMMGTIYKVNDIISAQGTVSFDLRIGIGVATGECVVGNMGSKQRFDYTVLGDVVNLASRLEGQTKGYGITTVLCKNTAAAVANLNNKVLEIDKIRVKGKTDPETIFGLLEDNAKKEELEVVSDYLKKFRSGDFKSAKDSLKPLLNQNDGPLKGFALLMLDRVEQLSKLPTNKNWDGVYTAESK